MLNWETDSRPKNNCLHPLLAAASRSSSSWAAWAVTWLLHHLRYGVMVRNNCLAYSLSAAMLSSQKIILLPWKEPYSAATSPMGRLRNPCRYITAIEQKSQWFG